MTYNEWRDELKNNLLCVSDNERRRVLDYYAEAYADRRDAGFTEREIIQDFGAPYDAAQRILNENERADYSDVKRGCTENPERQESRRERREREREEQREKERARERENVRYDESYVQHNTPPAPQPAKKRDDYTWVFVLLCVIFCVPLFGLIMAMVGITVGLCVSPFFIMISGFAAIGGAVGSMVGGHIYYGLYTLGGGIIAVGVSIILIPLFIKLVKLMWWLFKKLFGWLKSLFSGKEA